MLEQSIADEVEAAIKAGSAQKHLETFKRVTRLINGGLNHYAERVVYYNRALKVL